MYGDYTPYSLPTWALRLPYVMCHINPENLNVSRMLLGVYSRYLQV
jgi:hypothetical protein